MAVEQMTADRQEPWYALFVKTGAERTILGKLKYLNLDALRFHVPCREMRIRSGGKWILELQPMFPGYILAEGRLTDRSTCEVRKINDVYSWISDERGPLTIYPAELSLIRKLTDGEDVIRLSRVLYEGQKIRVVDGPLKGQEAFIRKVDRRKGRVKIALSVFGNEKLIDVSVENVQ